MELPVTTIVIVALSVMVLAVIGFFIMSSSNPQIQASAANSLFNLKCQEYKQKDCAWSVTREPDFGGFLDACRKIYGDERDKFSCLYVYCQPCKEAEANNQDLLCSSICDEAHADKSLNISTTSVCQQFRTECGTSTVLCGDVC